MNQIKNVIVLLIMAMVAGCGGSGAFTQATSTGSGGGTSGVTVTSLSLATTQTSVKSDNSNSATITATVLDANNAAVSGATVAFSASGGQLSAASATTDALGQATVVFSSGTADPTNRTATVTATASGVTPVQIPIIVTGSTVAITSDKPSLIIGGAAGADQATLTITVKNAASAAVYNTPITLSVAGSGSSPGAATVTPTSGTTNVSGQVTATLTATSPGTVTVTATGLGYTATQDFVITQAGAAFLISSPTNPATLQIGSTLTVTVTAPTQASVTFTSTLGTWDGGSNSLVTKPVVSGTASAVLASTTGGAATVEVIDAANPSTYATLTVLISAPSSQAAQIDLQSNVSVVAPSVGGTQSQATFTATVRTSGGTLVSGAPVAFTLSNTTGGGETISPIYGITDSTGKVTATFTSGSLSSDSTGVTVTATVYNSSSVAVATTSKNIKINQTAGSVVIGAGTTVGQPVVGGASYTLPMSVVVADSNGNPVQTTVTLSVWPAYYNTGYWAGRSGGTCAATITAAWDNEDLNRNLILDTGEDVPYVKGPYPVTSQGFTITDTGLQDGNNQEIYTVDYSIGIEGGSGPQSFVTDGILTPGNSAGGTLPATVTTDVNGLANFTLTYAKQYSVWIQDEIKATTTVLGTETTGILHLPLPFIATEGKQCQLYDSPFNPKTPAP